MRNRFFLFLFIATISTNLSAQKLAVHDSILSELHSVKIATASATEDSVFFKIAYPVNYDSTITYPVFLGLSGGDQREGIVNYCYAAWFRSDYFDNYITILPVSDSSKNLLHYSPVDIKNMLLTIKDNFKVTSENWIIAGTSNGGRATFKFIAEEPALFQGAIVIPGFKDDIVEVNDSWNDISIILAYGSKEDVDWIKSSKKTKKTLRKYVKNVKTIVLKKQGHILPIDFDIDIVYDKYFEGN